MQHNVVIAGADPVAVDAVGSTVMGYNPEDLEYLQLAALKRLGEIDVRKRAGRRDGRPAMSSGPTEWAPDEPASRTSGAASASGWSRPIGHRRREGYPLTTGRRITSQDRYVDLAYHLGPSAPDTVWAYTTLECDEAMAVDVWAGSEGRLEIFAAGEPPAILSPTDGHYVGELKARFSLPEGRSGLLLRLARGTSGFGFTLLLCGNRVPAAGRALPVPTC